MEKQTMKSIVPKGKTTLSPYLMVESVEEQIKFMINVFNVVITDDTKDKSGVTFHAEVLLGDTPVMIGRVSEAWPKRESMNFVYVEDADATYALALQNGATEILPPDNKPYGMREGGFADKFGNQWWVAQLIGNL
jgi:uncharacterized glyoxalase superfamily protein PhnB